MKQQYNIYFGLKNGTENEERKLRNNNYKKTHVPSNNPTNITTNIDLYELSHKHTLKWFTLHMPLSIDPQNDDYFHIIKQQTQHFMASIGLKSHEWLRLVFFVFPCVSATATTTPANTTTPKTYPCTSRSVK